MSPPSDREDRPPPGAPPEGRVAGVLDVTLSADWASASVARERVGRWLAVHGWPVAQATELVLAVSEAVSNSIEHGYGVRSEQPPGSGLVHLRGRVEPTGPDGFRRVELTVRDDGGWRESPEGRRGHGLLIMRACADELVVDGRDTGTMVLLRSRLAPPRT